jgi:hypothetical protein
LSGAGTGPVAVLTVVDDPDHPRIDPSLVTWGTGGHQAVVIRLRVPNLWLDCRFTVNLPVLTVFDRLDGMFY